jgi:uncharacterized membrane protein required for colicin V production
MGFLLTFALIVIFMICVGFLYTEGMWGNAIRLINVVTAALLATNFWEPLANFLEENISGSFSYFWDFISLWLLFSVFLVIFRLVTGFASRVKVRFLGLADRIGSGVFAAWIGWVMVCFTLMTLNTAPLKRDFLFGGFNPGGKMFLGMAPDQLWLGYVERMSKGPFSRLTPRAFDPEHEFIPKYASRRSTLADHLSTSTGGIRDILVSDSPKRITGSSTPSPPGESAPESSQQPAESS